MEAIPVPQPSFESEALRERSDPLAVDADDGATGGSIRIQPGIEYTMPGTGGSSCTLGFILRNRDGSTLYALTAGHCVDEGVHSLTLPDGTPFGVVEAYENTPNKEQDWGLIRILPSMRGSVSPSVTYWTGPASVSPPGALELGDTVCWYGQGGYPTFPDRCGLFYAYRGITTASSFTWIGTAMGGDSGSPMIDYATGQALGIVTHEQLPLIDGGSTVSQIFDRLAVRGYDLTLITAPYDPPPPMPI